MTEHLRSAKSGSRCAKEPMRHVLCRIDYGIGRLAVLYLQPVSCPPFLAVTSMPVQLPVEEKEKYRLDLVECK